MAGPKTASLLLNSTVFFLISTIQKISLGESWSVLQSFLLSDNSGPLSFLNKPSEMRTPKSKHISPKYTEKRAISKFQEMELTGFIKWQPQTILRPCFFKIVYILESPEKLQRYCYQQWWLNWSGTWPRIRDFFKTPNLMCRPVREPLP